MNVRIVQSQPWTCALVLLTELPLSSINLLLTYSPTCYITPLLYRLHWLPIPQRIHFKLFLFLQNLSVTWPHPPRLELLIDPLTPTYSAQTYKKKQDSMTGSSAEQGTVYFFSCLFALFLYTHSVKHLKVP